MSRILLGATTCAALLSVATASHAQSPCSLLLDVGLEELDGAAFDGVVDAVVMFYEGGESDDPIACASRTLAVRDGRAILDLDVCAPTSVSGCPTTPVRDAIEAAYAAGSEVQVTLLLDDELAASAPLGYVPVPIPDSVLYAEQAGVADAAGSADLCTLSEDSDALGGRPASAYVLAPDGVCEDGRFLTGFDRTGALTCEAPDLTGIVAQQPIEADCGLDAAVVRINPDGTYACASFVTAIDSAQFQPPTSITCPEGQGIAALATDGTGVCRAFSTDAGGQEPITVTCPAGQSIVEILPTGAARCAVATDLSGLQAGLDIRCGVGAYVTAIAADGTFTCSMAAGDGIGQPEMDTACPAGQFVSRIQPNGAVTCSTAAGDGIGQPEMDTSCPIGQFVSRIQPNGTVTCATASEDGLQPEMNVTCPSGLFVSQIDPDGSVACSRPSSASGTCPAGETVVGIGTDGTLECDVASGGGEGSQVLTAENADTFVARPASTVFVEGTIAVPNARFGAVDGTGIHLIGGTFEGTGAASEVELGNDTVIVGVTFRDVIIDGNDVTFLGCEFNGEIEMPGNATIMGGRITANISTARAVNRLSGVEIRDSVVPRVLQVDQCEIRDSVIGRDELNASEMSIFIGNQVDDSVVFGRSDSTVANNEFEDSFLHYPRGRGRIAITGNTFDRYPDGETEMLRIDVNGSSFIMVQVTGNVFNSDISASQAVTLTGGTGSNLQALTLSNNTFFRSAQAVNDSAAAAIIFRDNTLFDTSAGVTATGSNVVRTNDIVD